MRVAESKGDTLPSIPDNDKYRADVLAAIEDFYCSRKRPAQRKDRQRATVSASQREQD